MELGPEFKKPQIEQLSLGKGSSFCYRRGEEKQLKDVHSTGRNNEVLL